MTDLQSLALLALVIALVLSFVGMVYVLRFDHEAAELARRLHADGHDMSEEAALAAARETLARVTPYVLLCAITAWGLFGFFSGLAHGA